MQGLSTKIMRNLKLCILFIKITVECCVFTEEVFPITDSFSQNFQITELLQLKQSIDTISAYDISRKQCYKNEKPLTKSDNDDSEYVVEEKYLKTMPSAMALMENARGYTSSLDNSPWHQEEKPSKLETLFQITITSLAFLSFGGYLLCLIVQAIKSKGTTYFHPVATATTTTNGNVKRIKIYRRSRREALISTTIKNQQDIYGTADNTIFNYYDINQGFFTAPLPSYNRTLLLYLDNNHL